MAKKKAATQDFSKYIRWFWITFLGGILLIVFIFLLASWGAFGELPDHTVLENPNTNLATEIISSDGKTLGKFYLNDNRTPVDYGELPKHLVDALIATEDARFHEHSGIDARGTLRAIVFLGKTRWRKYYFTTIGKTIISWVMGLKANWKPNTQKIKEWIIAITFRASIYQRRNHCHVFQYL